MFSCDHTSLLYKKYLVTLTSNDIWSLGQFAYLKIDLSVCTLSQLLSLTKALFSLTGNVLLWQKIKAFDNFFMSQKMKNSLWLHLKFTTKNVEHYLWTWWCTLNPMIPKMMTAANTEVAQFVKATIKASLQLEIFLAVLGFKVELQLIITLASLVQ